MCDAVAVLLLCFRFSSSVLYLPHFEIIIFKLILIQCVHCSDEIRICAHENARQHCRRTIVDNKFILHAHRSHLPGNIITHHVAAMLHRIRE